MLLFFIAVALFVIADILIRVVLKRIKEKKIRQDREIALKASITVDFSHEAKTLKRAAVENPKARILCVDDEAVILDSFRKILVLEGYSVDTVESGPEALGLIKSHHYDFVFTDLKMPEMSGEQVTRAVKHARPDIDVIIITGYATVESAVECMQYGAMDYVQKPFTEDELLELTKKCLFKREEAIKKQLKPRVYVTPLTEVEAPESEEFAIPGGVFISKGHCWVSMQEDGSARVGIDDFAKKVIGRIDDVELPNLGMSIRQGQPLFSLKQGNRVIPFNAPVSGQVSAVNSALKRDPKSLDLTPYERNWVCTVDAEALDTELPQLSIGKAAVAFYQDEIEDFTTLIRKALHNGQQPAAPRIGLYLGQLERLDQDDWNMMVNKFFHR